MVQFVSYDAPEDVGGVSSWLQTTLPWLRAQGIDARVDLFCFGGAPGVNAAWYRRNNVPYRWSPWRGYLEEGVEQCLLWLNELLPHVYVPNCILPAYFAAAEAKRCGARTIGILHSDDPFYWGLVDHFVQGGEQWRLDELVVVSRFLRDSIQATPPPAMPLHEIPYGVRSLDRSVVAPGETFRIVYTGRLVEEQKRISELARAFCRVARENPELEAWIVGAGAGESSVRTIIDAEEMQGRVILKGRVEREFIPDVLEECHAFVLLSDYEGTPVSLLEAMSVGLVPICLDTRSGIGEVVKNSKNGIIVRDREQSFSKAVSFLLRDRDAWSALSSAARQTIMASYSEEVCLARWKALLVSAPHVSQNGSQPRLSMKLPPRSPKFGHFDQRKPSHARRLLRRLRSALGSGRKQIHDFVGSIRQD